MKYAHMPDPVAAWFAAHHGVISRDEARRLGLGPADIDRRVRAGVWERIFPGVYRLVGAPVGVLGAMRAAVLLGGLGAAVSHGSAAWLWGLLDTAPDIPTVTVSRNRTVRAAGVRAVRSRSPVTPVVRRAIPCTAAARTIVDCAAEVSAAELDDLVDRAVARRVLRIDALADVVGRPEVRHHPGRLALARRLKERGVTGSPAPSVLESRMARLFARHGLPAPLAEVVWGPNRRYRLDFAYPNLKLAIEVDGWSAHLAPEKLRSDNRRCNALIRAGWTVLRYTWWEVSFDPERVAREIAGAYRDRTVSLRAI